MNERLIFPAKSPIPCSFWTCAHLMNLIPYSLNQPLSSSPQNLQSKLWTTAKNCDFITCKDAECHFQLLYFTHKHETNFLSLIYFRYHVPTTYKRVEVYPRIFERHLRCTFASVRRREMVIEARDVSAKFVIGRLTIACALEMIMTEPRHSRRRQQTYTLTLI